MEKTRLLFVDNLRTLLIILVIMQHLSVTYGGHGGWYYEEGEPDRISGVVLTMHNAINQSFFMGSLFLISGYFTAGSYNRKGPWPFLKGRLVRLGIPLLVYDLVIHPIIVYILQIKIHGFDGSFWMFLDARVGSLHIGSGPLWFVETLLIFSFFYVLWRTLAGSQVASIPRKAYVPGNKAIAVSGLALGVITFAVRIWLPIGWNFAPLNLQLPFFLQYICLLILGAVAHRHDWLRRISDATGRFWLCVAMVLIFVVFPATFALGGAANDITPYLGGANWQSLVCAVWEQVVGIAIIITLLTVFRKRFNRQGRLAGEMSASSYATYIFHGPALVVITLTLRNLEMFALLKFALTVLVAVPLCFAVGGLIRRLPVAKMAL